MSLRIRTARLLLRPHRRGDVDHLARWEADPELRRLSEDDPEPPTRDEIAGALEHWLCGEEGVERYAVEVAGERDPIGYCQIALIDGFHGRCKVGLVIESARWGHGYGRETLEALVERSFGELDLHRIGADIYSFNTRSLALFERVGFRREGVLREHLLRDGRRHDEYVYGLLRHEWAAPRG